MRRQLLRATIAMIALVGTTTTSLAVAPEVEAATTTPDTQLVAAMKDVPEFGGAYVGADGALHVWLTKPTTVGAERARSAFARATTVVVHRADYTFTQLKAWHDRLAGLLGKSGVTLTDVDDRNNRLTVGIEDPAATGGRVKASLARLGIPLAAVDIVTATPVTPTLRDRTRPLRGGVLTQYAATNATGQCTLGLPAIRGGVFGFVTNSHCSAVRSQVDNGLYWQASREAGNNDLVGAEMVDPPFKTGGTCPAGQRCRLSDTNFVRTDVEVAVGRIARPALGSTNWNGTDTFRVTAAFDTAVGNTVQKVGQTTGRTQGTVVRTCASRTVRDTNITLLCQDLADYTAADGDSGAPVFEVTNSPSTNDVRVVGVHWGGSVIDNRFISTFSGYRFIIPEIGFINVCAVGSC
jgi:hypothetical protein